MCKKPLRESMHNSVSVVSAIIMAGLSRRFLEARSRFQLPSLPEKWKGGRIERWANFWKNLAIDYKEAGMDIVQGAKDKPLKAAVYTSLGLSALYFNR